MRIPGLQLRVEAEALAWRETGSAGVKWLLLGPSQAPGQGSARESAVLIRMEPGHGYPAHRHLDVEEVLILAGGYRDGAGDHYAPSYLRYDSGSVHAPVALGDPERAAGPDNPACLLFASARGGIALLERSDSTNLPHVPGSSTAP